MVSHKNCCVSLIVKIQLQVSRVIKGVFKRGKAFIVERLLAFLLDDLSAKQIYHVADR